MHFRLAPNPFGNTFGLFCSSRVQPALLGNVSPHFSSPEGAAEHSLETLFPLSLQKGYPARARRLHLHFWDAYTPLFVPGGCRLALLSNVCPHFFSEKLDSERLWYSLMSATIHFWIAIHNNAT